MNIHQIAQRLNELAHERQFRIAQLHKLRANVKTTKKYQYIFGERTVFDKNRAYAYHYGGRGEAQFNIGTEQQKGKSIFRYILAFSLQRNQTITNPLERCKPKIEKFNRYVTNNPDAFEGIKMWHFQDGGVKKKRSRDYPVTQIPESWIREGNFIAIGKYFEEPIDTIQEEHLLKILELFDQLLPVYEFIEIDNTVPDIEDKISRICWNTSGWVKPSGMSGKSPNKNSFEYQYRYGNEEWLLDLDKRIDGYHYAFLQSVYTKSHKHEGQIYNIAFYSFDHSDKTWYWVGKILNVEVINNATAKNIKEIYRQKGWFDQMIDDLRAVGADTSMFGGGKPIETFNIRFKPVDVRWLDDKPVSFDNNEEPSTKRYKLLDGTAKLPLIYEPRGNLKFPKQHSRQENGIVTKQLTPKTIEYLNIHSILQDKFVKYLKGKFPSQKISHEASTIINTQIDVVREKAPGKYVFYEIKTYNIVRSSIRAALGQLFEYALFPDRRLADELVIVSFLPADEDIQKYIRHLNRICRIPIVYIQFDYEKGEVRQEIRGE